MRIQILSDLHLEFPSDYQWTPNNADVIILAGDIHLRNKGLQWAIETLPTETPVLYILGNHEFYGKAHPKLITDLKQHALKTPNIRILENDIVTINDINFMGCTLWTDFELFGNAPMTGWHCQHVFTDYKKIRKSPQYSKIRSLDIHNIHCQSRRWLETQLQIHSGETNIVITHHGPSMKSLPEGQEDKAFNAGYISNLESFIIQNNPSVWIHGHVHNSSDYTIGNCRILCNPKGYPDELNPGFLDSFIIEI